MISSLGAREDGAQKSTRHSRSKSRISWVTLRISMVPIALRSYRGGLSFTVILAVIPHRMNAGCDWVSSRSGI
jgi:hypothetical protein